MARGSGLVARGFVVAALAAAPVEAATSCEGLAALALPNAQITSAQTVAAGAFNPPRGGSQIFARLPAFCRVTATLTPSSDSDIKIEVWLPDPDSVAAAASWNGKFQAVGNGGWAGVISYPALAQAVASGYASASTDTGHVGNTAAFAIGHPEKVIDMGYRAVHEMTVKAKLIIDAYYGSAPKLSFWNGCSLGGRQGITEAQRYPEDFDAIVAGAPAVNWMKLHGARMAINKSAHASERGYITPDKYPAIHDAALAACDTLDGIKDGVIENPTRCHFDPKVLQCKGAGRPAMPDPRSGRHRAPLYAPLKSAKNGAPIFPLAPDGGLRAELGDARRSRADHHRLRGIQVRGVQGSELGRTAIRRRTPTSPPPSRWTPASSIPRLPT